MKCFRFENIWLLSNAEKKARLVSFHPRRNLLIGRNHTGKTSLIHSLFVTLGAKPQGKLDYWDNTAASLLEFSLNSKRYFALHETGRRALFDESGTLLQAATTHSEWSKAFGDLVGFNLVFTEKSEADIEPADPACFFLPYYINQDGSWQAEWNTFQGLKRFSSPQGAVLEYFSGICPPDYYRARAEKNQISRELGERRQEMKLLQRTLERFSEKLNSVGVKLDAQGFEDEVNRLTLEVNRLADLQRVVRKEVVQDEEVVNSLRHQIRLTEDALYAHDEDAKYLDKDKGPFICPTCHAEHSRSFFDLLTFSEDARVLRQLCTKLREDEFGAVGRLRERKKYFQGLEASYQSISQLLESRRGEMTFGDVVKSVGAEKAQDAFELERVELKKACDDLVLKIDDLEERISELRDPKKSRAILEEFRARFAEARRDLKLPPTDVSKMKLVSRPNLSGSGGPRSILAYYAALWRVSHSGHNTFDIPVVIDSPNQQAQDDINLPAVLGFISDQLPGTQLIVGLENAMTSSFEFELHLDKPYSLLLEDEWELTEKRLRPFLDAMYQGVGARSVDVDKTFSE